MNRLFGNRIVHVFQLLVLAVLFQVVLVTSPLLADGGWPTGEPPWQPSHPNIPEMDWPVPPGANDMDDFIPPGLLRENHPRPVGGVPVNTLPVAATGRVFVFDNRLGTVVEDNTMDRSVQLRLDRLDVVDAPITATNTITSPVQSMALLRFEIEALAVGTGQPVQRFQKPVRIVLDLRDLTDGLDPSYNDFYLSYQDENDPTVWHEVETTVHEASGLISAEVMHFSGWEAGVRPERWTPNLIQPGGSEFSGAATYSYPIETPPGRNGLQPSVALSYNSRSIDGMIQNPDQGSLATGWSIAETSISRVGVRLDQDYGIPYTYHPDQFRISFGGIGHVLYPVVGADTTNDPIVRYYAKDGPGLLIYRYYKTAAQGSQNTDGIYWVITTAEGTQYRLGFTADSEQTQTVTSDLNLKVDGHEGHDNVASGIVWRLDTVTDIHGNQMTYHYFDRPVGEPGISYWDGTYWKTMNLTTNEKRLAEIKYNYSTQVTGTLPFTTTLSQLTSTPASRVEFRHEDDNTGTGTYGKPLDHIYVYHNSGTTPTNEYRIDSEKLIGTSSSGCLNPEGNPQQSETRVINSIQRFVNVDNDPSTTDSGTAYTLPATTFDYTPFPHFYKDNNQAYPCFKFFYLTEVNNGYGGTFTFDYGSDGRQVGDYWHEETPTEDVLHWPDIGYNYFVTETTAFDGFNTTSVEYSYYKPCYNQTDSTEVGPMQDALACSATDAPEFGNINGFGTTTVTTKGFSAETLNVKKSYFHNLNADTNDKIGRLYKVEVFKPNGTTLLSQQLTTFTVVGIAGSGAKFTYADSVITTNYQNGSGSTTMSSKVVYDYATGNQGGVQYGNQTHVYEYRDVNDANPYRTTRTWYYPNTSNWIVNKAGQVGVYEGGGWTEVSLNWLYYDGGSSPSTTPTKGNVTRTSRRMLITCSEVVGGGGPGCSYGRQTIESTITYDSYGNPTVTKSYGDYGYYSFESDGTPINSFPPSDDRATTITYETGFNLYPISVKNDLNQTTSFQVYGFNGVMFNANGFQEQRGLLKQVTDPNGNVTKYEYEPFGRLHAVYDEFDLSGFDDDDGSGNPLPWNGRPLSRYRYWDNYWNNGSTVFLDPANDAPFVIASQTRPNEFTVSSQGYEFTDQTYFDGFGRGIQQQVLYADVSDQTNRRDIITTTNYNARGSESCVTTPYDVPKYSDRETWPASGFVTDACTSVAKTTMAYDDRGRVTSVTTPDGNSTTTTYTYNSTITVDGDSKLLLTQVVDANGHITNNFTNAFNQLVLVREISGTGGGATQYADTRYFYDEAGNLDKVGTSNPTDSAPTSWLRESTMSYNEFGQKTGMDDADMGQWSYDYNPSGTLRWQKDANGEAICFAYDELERLEVKFIDSTPTNDSCQTPPTSGSNHLATYIYDTATNGVGLPAEVKWGPSPSGNYSKFYYDGRSRMYKQERKINGLQYTMDTTSFDALNRPLTVKYPDTEVVTYAYDREGEDTLAAGSDSLVTAIKYNERGQLARLDRGNSTDTTYSYFGASENFRLQIADTTHYDTPPTYLLDLNYTYDEVGNIETIVDDVSGDSQSFSYDHLDRLTSAAATGGYANYSETYSYDKIGNLLTINKGGQNHVFDYYTNQPQAVESVVEPGGGFGDPTTPLYDFVYDDNGNMTEREDHITPITYTQEFDVENRMITVTNNLTTTETIFTYDDSGQRTSTSVENAGDSRVITYFPFPAYEKELHQDWECVPDWGGCTWTWSTEETITRKTYSAGGQAIATRVSGDPVSTNNGLFYFHSDHLGSATFLTHGNGHANEGLKVANSTKFFTPFGEYRIQPPSPTDDITDRGYTGHKHNDEIGLIYMNARYYVGAIGRFASADTLIPYPNDPQSHNRYSYVRNNALNSIDPTGHIDCPDPDAGCAPANTPPPDITQEEYEDTIIAAIKEERSGSSNSRPKQFSIVCDSNIYEDGCRVENTTSLSAPEECTRLNSGGYYCPSETPYPYLQYNPYLPEYFKVGGGGSLVVGVSGYLIIDVYGNIYVSWGPEYSWPGLSGSASVGFVQAKGPTDSEYRHINPDEATLENILTGNSMGYFSGGFIVGWDLAAPFYIEADGTSYLTSEYGLYTPQFMFLSFNTTIMLYDSP